MTQTVSRTSVATSPRDVGPRRAIVAACAAMIAVLALDLTDGRLGLLYSVGFVLIVVTVPLSIDVRALLPAGVLPPVLLIGSLLAVCVLDPSAVRVTGLADDAGTVARLIASVIDHGPTLVIGHGLALALIAARIVTAPAR